MPSNDAFYTNNNNNNDVVKDRNQFIDPNDDQVEPTDNSVCQGCQSVIDPSNDTSISDIDGDDDGDGNTRPIYCDTPNSQCSSSVSNQNSHHTDDVSSYGKIEIGYIDFSCLENCLYLLAAILN